MMNSFIPIVCVVGCLILCTLEKGSNKIFLIDSTELYSYTYSGRPTNQLVALSADRRSLLFYDVEKQSPNPASVDLPLPGELLAVTADGKRAAVSHDSYITIVVLNHRGHIHSVKTYLTSVAQASSVLFIEESACLISAIDYSTYIKCLDMDSGTTCTCSNIISAGSRGFTNTAKNWVYVVDQGLNPQSMYKYNVSRQSTTKTLCTCLKHIQHDGINFGGNGYYGQRLWYSYDGSRIFLESGWTLTASDKDKLDMKPHGDFNASHEIYRYSYFSQSFKYPYVIAGIRSDTNNTIYYYSWPSLLPIDSKTTTIPAPPQSKIIGAEEVHICDETDTIYAVVKYSFSDGTTKIGVVTE